MDNDSGTEDGGDDSSFIAQLMRDTESETSWKTEHAQSLDTFFGYVSRSTTQYPSSD